MRLVVPHRMWHADTRPDPESPLCLTESTCRAKTCGVSRPESNKACMRRVGWPSQFRPCNQRPRSRGRTRQARRRSRRGAGPRPASRPRLLPGDGDPRVPGRRLRPTPSGAPPHRDPPVARAGVRRGASAGRALLVLVGERQRGEPPRGGPWSARSASDCGP